MSETTAKRRKPKAERKSTGTHIRMTDAEKERFSLAAKRVGLDLSNWIRTTLTQKADEVLK